MNRSLTDQQKTFLAGLAPTISATLLLFWQGYENNWLLITGSGLLIGYII